MSEQDRERHRAFDTTIVGTIEEARHDLLSGVLAREYRGRLVLSLLTPIDRELRLVASTGDSQHTTAFLAALPEVLGMLIAMTAATTGAHAASIERTILACTQDSLAAYGTQGASDDDGDAPGNGVH